MIVLLLLLVVVFYSNSNGAASQLPQLAQKEENRVVIGSARLATSAPPKFAGRAQKKPPSGGVNTLTATGEASPTTYYGTTYLSWTVTVSGLTQFTPTNTLAFYTVDNGAATQTPFPAGQLTITSSSNASVPYTAVPLVSTTVTSLGVSSGYYMLSNINYPMAVVFSSIVFGLASPPGTQVINLLAANGEFSSQYWQAGYGNVTLHFNVTTSISSLSSTTSYISFQSPSGTYIDPTNISPAVTSVTTTTQQIDGQTVTVYDIANQTLDTDFKSSYTNGVWTISLSISTSFVSSLVANGALIATLYFDDGTSYVTCPATLSLVSDTINAINYQTINAAGQTALVVEGSPIVVTFTTNYPVSSTDSLSGVQITSTDPSISPPVIYFVPFNTPGSTLTPNKTTPTQWTFTTPPLIAQSLVSPSNFLKGYSSNFGSLAVRLSNGVTGELTTSPVTLLAVFAPPAVTNTLALESFNNMIPNQYNNGTAQQNIVLPTSPANQVAWINFADYYSRGSGGYATDRPLASVVMLVLSSALKNASYSASTPLSVEEVPSVYQLNIPGSYTGLYNSSGTYYIPYYDAQTGTVPTQTSAFVSTSKYESTLVSNFPAAEPVYMAPIVYGQQSQFYNPSWSYQVQIGNLFPQPLVTPPTPVWNSAAPPAAAGVPANLSNYCFAVQLPANITSPVPASNTIPYIDAVNQKISGPTAPSAAFTVSPAGWYMSDPVNPFYLIPAATNINVFSLQFNISTDAAGQDTLSKNNVDLLPYIVGPYVTSAQVSTASGTVTGYDISAPLVAYINALPAQTITTGTTYYIVFTSQNFDLTPLTISPASFTYVSSPSVKITTTPAPPAS